MHLLTVVIINKMYAIHDNFHSLNEAVFPKGYTPDIEDRYILIYYNSYRKKSHQG